VLFTIRLRRTTPGQAIISRGNYQKELFLKENTGAAFERALMETVERCGWKLHAYVMMSHLIQNKA
jgi:hypothetical protein